ncbi:MAG: hypothetical protein V8Q75_03560 [Bacilli bacterium]
MDENKNPAFLFYSSDFLTGVRLMTYEEIGKYITLLCLQHQQGHLSKDDMNAICGIYIPRIYNKFQQDSDGKYFNNRLEIEGIKRAKYTESRRQNRLKKTYVKHMENENVNENINIYINTNNYSNNLKNIIISWLEYKLEKNDQYQEKGFKSLLTQIKNNVDKFGEDKVIETINSSMSSNYKGIIWDKLKKQTFKSSLYKSNYEISQEALRRAREELEDE